MYGRRLDVQPHKYDARRTHADAEIVGWRRLRPAIRDFAWQGDRHPGGSVGTPPTTSRGCAMTRRTATGFTNYLARSWCCRAVRSPRWPQAPAVADRSDVRVRSDAGIELQLRNKRPAGPRDIRRAGASCCSCMARRFRRAVAFDCRAARRHLDGRRGGARLRRLCARHPRLRRLDATRPRCRSRPKTNPPFAGAPSRRRATLARRWTSSCARRRVDLQLTLIGWSWGTTTTAAFAAGNPAARSSKLVLVSPVWLGVQPPVLPGRLPHQHARQPRARSRLRGIAEGARRGDLRRSPTFDALVGRRHWPPTRTERATIRRRCCARPTARCEDFAKFWAAGKPDLSPGRHIGLADLAGSRGMGRRHAARDGARPVQAVPWCNARRAAAGADCPKARISSSSRNTACASFARCRIFSTSRLRLNAERHMLQLRPELRMLRRRISPAIPTPRTSAPSNARSARAARPATLAEGQCPNCGGELVRRPRRAAEKLPEISGVRRTRLQARRLREARCLKPR